MSQKGPSHMWFIRLKNIYTGLLWKFGVETDKSFTNTPSEREFCSRCKSINLKDILSHPEYIRPKYGVEVARLGELGSWDTDKCPLYQLFYSTIFKWREPGFIYDNYNLYAFTSPTAEEIGIDWTDF